LPVCVMPFFPLDSKLPRLFAELLQLFLGSTHFCVFVWSPWFTDLANPPLFFDRIFLTLDWFFRDQYKWFLYFVELFSPPFGLFLTLVFLSFFLVRGSAHPFPCLRLFLGQKPPITALSPVLLCSLFFAGTPACCYVLSQLCGVTGFRIGTFPP